MTPLKNDLLIRALLRQPVSKTPVWLMRQAGRYLPEYRATREKAGNFMTLCSTPELACEVTLQPLARFNLDAAILFSDILTIPDAMGLGLHFVENEGPHFERPIRTKNDILALGIPDPETELRYVNDAVRLICRELQSRIPLIGFAGSPWTLATYMIEGKSTKDFSLIKKMLYQNPDYLHTLLDLLANAVAVYLNAQIAAGVHAVMIFDTWGGVLTTKDYQDFSLYYMEKIISQLNRSRAGETIPVIVFTKGGGQWLENIAAIGCDAIGIDWTQDIGQARSRVGHQVALQGNLDPMVLFAPVEKIQQEVKIIMDNFGHHPGHIFNLGHGILPATPIEHVTQMIEAVHRNSQFNND